MTSWSSIAADRTMSYVIAVEEMQFRDKHLTFAGWIKALAFNTISDFKDCLDEKYHRMTAGTIVRKFLNRPAAIKTTADEIVVKFDYFRECNALKEYCDKINQSNLEISEANLIKLS